MAAVSISSRKNRAGNSPISDSQREAVQQAADNAERMAIRGLRVLDEIWNQPGRGQTRRNRRRSAWRANPEVVRWFGDDDLTNTQIRDTRRRMKKIRDEFRSNVRFTIIHHQSGDQSFLCDTSTVAYCSPGTPIKVCPNWFDADQQRRAGIVIHELSHKNGHIHHRGATDPASAQRLARENPRWARRNPENFEGFCGEYF